MATIFIADDNPAMLSLFERTFKLSGYTVETATDGEEALARLSASKMKPDMILLDIMMPQLSGFEVLERIKKDDDLKTVPVMALTNLASLANGVADLEKIRALGAVDVIIKSDMDPKELVKKVENFITHG